jgi:hypothetical protein
MKADHMTERAIIERHLAQAETHVVQGDEHIARQKEIVAELGGDGHEEAAQKARELLKTFEMTQRAHVKDRDRLRAELAALD